MRCSQAQLEKKVKNYLRNSEALEDDWQRPITAQQLQSEMDRMAQNSRQPEVLQELFEALGNDPFVIAECLARPVLVERLLAHPEFERVKQQSRTFDQTAAAGANYILPRISDPSAHALAIRGLQPTSPAPQMPELLTQQCGLAARLSCGGATDVTGTAS